MSLSFERRQFLSLIAAGSAAVALGGLSCSRKRTGPPNIVLLFADDMGYGDLSCYGHPTIKTPFLDQMAREGIRMTSFYSTAALCSPSRAAMLTGRYPLRCGMPYVLGPDSENGLPESEITMADALKKAGYRTMAIGKWHIGHVKKEFMPTSRGFDAYYGLLYSNDMMPPWVKTEKPLQLYRDLEPIEHPVEQETLTERYTDEAVKFIKSAKGGPFFLYLPYTMPHLPVRASEKFSGTSRAGLYGDVIETIDWSAGKILQTLKELGLDNNTLVLFTSDNGPWCNMPPRMLHEGIEKWHAGTPGILRGAKGTTYEGGHRVPGIARWPGVIPAGQVTAEPANTMDLFTTILKVCGADVPDDRVIDGLDILPLLKGQAKSPMKEFYYMAGYRLQAVREGKWKYRLTNPAGDKNKRAGKPLRELYDLDADPSEKYNVVDRHPDLAAKLDQKLKAMAKELKANIAE